LNLTRNPKASSVTDDFRIPVVLKVGNLCTAQFPAGLGNHEEWRQAPAAAFQNMNLERRSHARFVWVQLILELELESNTE